MRLRVFCSRRKVRGAAECRHMDVEDAEQIVRLVPDPPCLQVPFRCPRHCIRRAVTLTSNGILWERIPHSIPPMCCITEPRVAFVPKIDHSADTKTKSSGAMSSCSV